MVHIFYLFGIIYLMHELFAILNPFNHTWKMERLIKFANEHAGKKLEDLPPDVKNISEL